MQTHSWECFAGDTHKKKKKTRDKYKAKDLVSPVRSLLHLIRNQLNVIKRVPGV